MKKVSNVLNLTRLIKYSIFLIVICTSAWYFYTQHKIEVKKTIELSKALDQTRDSLVKSSDIVLQYKLKNDTLIGLMKIADSTVNVLLNKDNNMTIEDFVTKYKLAKIERYLLICERKPQNQKFFYGWIRRTMSE